MWWSILWAADPTLSITTKMESTLEHLISIIAPTFQPLGAGTRTTSW